MFKENCLQREFFFPKMLKPYLTDLNCYDITYFSYVIVTNGNHMVLVTKHVVLYDILYLNFFTQDNPAVAYHIMLLKMANIVTVDKYKMNVCRKPNVSHISHEKKQNKTIIFKKDLENTYATYRNIC